jgi:hypothetical protein
MSVLAFRPVFQVVSACRRWISAGRSNSMNGSAIGGVWPSMGFVLRRIGHDNLLADYGVIIPPQRTMSSALM